MSAHAAREPRRDLPLGVWGVATLILTEGSLFVTILGSYWYLRYREAAWPPAGVEHPKVALPLVLTGVLIASAVPVALAARAAVAGRAAWARTLLGGALVTHMAYLAVQIVLLRDDLHHVDPRATAYGSILHGMVITHHAHVVVGILLEAALLARLALGLTPYRIAGLRAIAWYWAFVAAIGIPVVLTQVSPSL